MEIRGYDIQFVSLSLADMQKLSLNYNASHIIIGVAFIFGVFSRGMIEFFKNKFAGKIDFYKKYLHESIIITTSVANTICRKLTKKTTEKAAETCPNTIWTQRTKYDFILFSAEKAGG